MGKLISYLVVAGIAFFVDMVGASVPLNSSASYAEGVASYLNAAYAQDQVN